MSELKIGQSANQRLLELCLLNRSSCWLKANNLFLGAQENFLNLPIKSYLKSYLISLAFYKGVWNNWIVKIQAVQRSERAFQTKENFTQWIIGQSKALPCLIFVIFLHNRNLRPRNCTLESVKIRVKSCLATKLYVKIYVVCKALFSHSNWKI